jgi:hypothetical protein
MCSPRRIVARRHEEVLAVGEFAWWLLAVLLVLCALGGLAAAAAAIERWLRRLDQCDQDPALLTHGAWGDPDIGPPSVSPEARAEVAELEALWALPPHHASSGTD